MSDLHEADYGSNFDEGEDELGLTVPLDTKEVDGDGDDEEYRDEYGLINLAIPVTDSYGSRHDFQG